ncbi:MAG: chemotaxis protein CheR [Betaproteobacteria bacterium]|nr:chemotaxis protein CheR [Betaproteobacteria bacterium]
MQTHEATERAVDNGREFIFTAADFERVRKLIRGRAGISLSPSKHEMVYSRVGRRLRALGLSDFRDYLLLLEKGDATEWEAFTNSLTTNLTAFFREEHHFPLLAELLKRHKSSGQIALWCSAASTGEEPYSMAMTAAEAFGTLTPPVRILATDIDTSVLAKAEQGVYAMERLEKMPEERIRRYFLRGKGRHAGQVRVRDELRALINYRPLNLLDAEWPIRGPFRAIFCRNVMIYFDKPTQYGILQKFVPLLHPDGLLFAGHSESFHHAADLFRPRGKTVYEPAGRGRGPASGD